MNVLSRLSAAGLLAATGAASAQNFSLEGAVIDSGSARSLGVISERGDINALFRAQKAVTFGILRSAGISLDQLPSDIRARIERFQTTNLDAFRAFSQGLDLKDQGKFLEAKAFFRRAAELDPGFALASEQQQAMPDVNVGSGVQARAVMLAAAGAAVDRGKASFSVDTARAVAAIAAGQTVIATTVAAPAAATDYTTNPPGSGTQGGQNLVAGLAYSVALPSGATAAVASAAEWAPGTIRVDNGVLQTLGGSGGFLAQRNGAVNGPGGSEPLGNSVAYWGSWISAPGASATVYVSGQAVTAPNLGRVDYVVADATRQMPSAGTANYLPVALGGSLGQPTGTIGVNFVTRLVELHDLGFSIGALTFAGLNGSATYSASIGSGTFGGNYTSGTCSGCVAFTPLSSRFDGSFAGPAANGLVFSTFLLTGAGGTASGVHLFKQP